VDRNFWGVTFADDDNTFYATAASGSTTWLMRGSLKAKSLVSLRTDAECPSLSPDQTKIAYKKRLDSKARGVWRLAVLDLRTGQESLLAETRSVDDQVEWLDGNRLLYGVSRPGSEATTSDVWVVPADGTGSAQIFIPEASSPAVVR
jgi:Tol biopolymer transport system component